MFLDSDSAPLKVKICGVTRAADAQSCIAEGADAIGINFYPKSKRYISLDACESWLSSLAGQVTRVGVFVNAPVGDVEAILRSGLIDVPQFHGNETAEYCQGFADQNIPFIKAVGVKDRRSLEAVAAFPTPHILLDAYCPDDFGGAGRIFDWDLAAEFVQAHPELRVMLSGGLKPQNVSEAVRRVNPIAVDVASGVESAPGRKDPKAIAAFIRSARGAL